LAAADFLHPEPQAGVLRFKHGITRDAVYDSIRLDERTALHQRIAVALHDVADLAARDDALELKAYHARGAGQWAPAAQLAEQAGDRAMAAFAIDRARAHYLVAMDAVERLSERGPAEAARWCLLTNKLGMACIFDLLAMPDALPIFERALLRSREAADDGVTARAHYWLGYMCFGHGRLRRAAEHCRQALRIASAVADRRLVAQVEATLGQVLGATSQYDEALGLMDRALTAKQGHVRSGSSVAVGSAFTLASRGGALGDRGEFPAAYAAFDEARVLIGASHHPVANSLLNWMLMVLLWQGRWHEAAETAQRSAQLAENTRALLPLALARVAGGQARWMGEGAVEGFDQMVEAVRWLEQRQVQFFTSIYYGWLVEACVELGHLAQARRYAARLFSRAREGEIVGRAAGCRGLALAMSRAGDVARARRYLKRAEACAAQRGSRRDQALNLLCQAQILACQGDIAASAAVAAQARTQLQALGMDWHAQRATLLG
ncbi:tetratricopeptide repeat protein, partial [Rhodoferax sp.]|uniref:tetratricopeptide repeat protein n=1 Tax=Rhodoferax sp. TaxID=50421 RepID=UPI00374D7370